MNNYIKKFQLPATTIQQSDSTSVVTSPNVRPIQMTLALYIQNLSANQPQQTIRPMTDTEVREMNQANYRESGQLAKDAMSYIPVLGDVISAGDAVMKGVNDGQWGEAIAVGATSLLPSVTEKIPGVRQVAAATGRLGQAAIHGATTYLTNKFNSWAGDTLNSVMSHEDGGVLNYLDYIK